MAYYPYSISNIRTIIKMKKSRAVPKRDQKEIYGHILWMCDDMERWWKKIPLWKKGLLRISKRYRLVEKRSAKAGRWIGWIFGQMQELELISEDQAKSWSLTDVRNGNY